MEIKVKCPTCGNEAVKKKFCSECGTLLEKKSVEEGPKIFPGSITQSLMTNNGSNISNTKPDVGADTSNPDDTRLTLLVNYCRKTFATVGGDGYSEIVLYHDEGNDTYQVHTYEKYEYMEKEVHKAYRTDGQFKNAVYQLIRENELADYENKKMGIPKGGGAEILKFKDEKGRVIRLEDNDFPEGKGGLIADIRIMLYSAVAEKNRI